MRQLTRQEIEQHSTILAWLHIVGNAVLIAFGLFLFVLLGGIGVFSGDAGAMVILSIIGTALAGIMVLLGLPGILAGYGLLKRRAWGRVLAIVVGILGLVNFPIGTVIGLYTLWVLLQEQAPTVFSESRGVYAAPPAV
jgi:hypothetical protein